MDKIIDNEIKKAGMIFLQLTEQLSLLKDLLELLENEQYRRKISFLGNASIGGHTRHVIELLACVTNGYLSGDIDYVNRVRDLSIENDRNIAIASLNRLIEDVTKPDKTMFLIIDADQPGRNRKVSSTYFREIVYNAEHAIHHLALIRVALREMKLEIVGEHFGMAYSTIQYLTSQEQN